MYMYAIRSCAVSRRIRAYPRTVRRGADDDSTTRATHWATAGPPGPSSEAVELREPSYGCRTAVGPLRVHATIDFL